MINPDTITVASVPKSHAYVEHLGAVGCAGRVTRLPDPVPPGAEGTDRWWPPRWLDPHWLEQHVQLFDVFHLHFGFDAMPVAALEDIVRILDSSDKPLVFTVHDLHNPHFADNAEHEAHLDVLVGAADEIITLTAGAAREIAARWDRRATVVPHPHVAPLDLIDAPPRVSGAFVIGLHMKNLRANLDPLAVLDTVVDTASRLPDAVVRIDVEDTVFDIDRAEAADVETALDRYRSVPCVDIRVHPRFDDGGLWQYLTEIDVSVLAYRFGTHSGWLEACYDLGTAVIAPDCGHFSDQQSCRTYGFGLNRFDSPTLSAALCAAYDDRFAPPAVNRVGRERQRREIAEAHEAIYTRALARRSVATGTRR